MSSQPTPRLIPLAEARLSLSPQEFRLKLRKVLLANPRITLKQIAKALNVTRQRVSLLVGRLDRPNCAPPGPRPAPKREAARTKLSELTQRVAQGESAEGVVKDLGISLNQARTLGFKVRQVRSAHGTQARAIHGCDCWRCRRTSGVALPRGPRFGPRKKVEVLDWLAYKDPDTNQPLRQVDIARLSGVGQGAVSRISRAEDL